PERASCARAGSATSASSATPACSARWRSSSAPPRLSSAGQPRLELRVVLPGRHLRHEGQRVLLGLRLAGRRIALELPLHHLAEALLERLQLAALVDAVVAIGPALDGHAAALAIGLHRLVSWVASIKACVPRISARRSLVLIRPAAFVSSSR